MQIDDDVEIGAGTTIDRARFGRTWIQEGVKVDNLVQIAHNVVIGRIRSSVAQVGISGSTRVGQRVILAGQVGVAGHIEIEDNAVVGAQAGVTKSLRGGGVSVGNADRADGRFQTPDRVGAEPGEIIRTRESVGK